AVRRCHRAEAEDRPRRADDAVESRRHDLLAVAVDLGADVLRQAPGVPAVDRIRPHESLRQPDDADFEAAGELHAGGGAHGQLDTAAPDVDDDRAARADVDAVHRGEMDQPYLLAPCNDT